MDGRFGGLPKSSFAIVYHFLAYCASPNRIPKIQKDQMAQQPQQLYSAKNLREFQQISKQNGDLRLHAQLHENELQASASNWTLRHLLAFRLLTLPEKPFLETLKSEHKDCPVCKNPNSEALDDVWKNILTADCSLDLKGNKDSELLKRPGGFFGLHLHGQHALRLHWKQNLIMRCKQNLMMPCPKLQDTQLAKDVR